MINNTGIMAQLQQVINKFDLSEKTPVFIRSSVVSADGLKTIANVSNASGGVASVFLQANAGTNQNARVKITVDGVVLDDTENSTLANGNASGVRAYGTGGLFAPIGNYGLINFSPAGSQPNIPATIGFKQSFKVEASTTSGTGILVGVSMLV